MGKSDKVRIRPVSIYTSQYLAEFLSNIMTLEPGDVILTGTPGGVGIARDPQVWLKDGDVVQISIDKVGVLENKVVLVKEGYMSNKTVQEYLSSIEKSLDGIVTACKGLPEDVIRSESN